MAHKQDFNGLLASILFGALITIAGVKYMSPQEKPVKPKVDH